MSDTLTVTCNKTKVLGYLYRGFSQAECRCLVCLLVRPVLNYYSPIWNPYQANSIDKFEQVQTFAAIFAIHR